MQNPFNPYCQSQSVELSPEALELSAILGSHPTDMDMIKLNQLIYETLLTEEAL